MKVNYRVIYLAEKVTDFGLNLIPDELLKNVKTLVTGKGRSKVLSNTQTFFDGRITKAMNNFDMCRKVAGFNPKDKVVLELGSGGHGVDLIFLYLLGAKKIYTVDIRFFGFLYMAQAVNDFENHLAEMASVFGVDESELRARYETLKKEDSVEGFMKVMNITFLTFDELRKGADVITDKADFFFSESNLQRIPLKYINKTLAQAAKCLNPGAIMFHRVDTGDINIQPTRPLHDPNLYRFHFLKYSDKGWRRRITERIGSQNRLRQPEYLKIFTDLGFDMVYSENYLYKDDVEKMADFSVNERFEQFSDRENAIAHSRLIGVYKPKAEQELEEKNIYVNESAKAEVSSRWNREKGLRG